jgi:hypothetical protein
MKRILGSILLIFAVFSLGYAGWLTWAKPGTPSGSNLENREGNPVLVYFIHGRAKCPTCDLILAHTRSAMKTSFSEETGNGSLVLVPVDVEKPGNEHFMEDFGLFTTSVVLFSRNTAGKEHWKNLSRAWELAEDSESFKTYFSGELHRFLQEARP